MLPRICAVRYLNTAPLVWGLSHGPQKGEAELEFLLPSACADTARSGRADAGLVPVIEMARQGLVRVASVGIATRGDVRSILLVARKPLDRIQTLAADSGSRTSVVLAKILLSRRYQSTPAVISMRPDLPSMLEAADAALIIGDAALALDPDSLDGAVLDLGREWLDYCGLPMVFAAWCSPPDRRDRIREHLFEESYDYGARRLDDIIESEAVPRGFSPQLAAAYFKRHIQYSLGAEELRGLAYYLSEAEALGLLSNDESAIPQYHG